MTETHVISGLKTNHSADMEPMDWRVRHDGDYEDYSVYRYWAFDTVWGSDTLNFFSDSDCTADGVTQATSHHALTILQSALIDF
jgi:hypothetical protein